MLLNEKIYGHCISWTGLQLITATRSFTQLWRLNATSEPLGRWHRSGAPLKVFCNQGLGFVPVRWSPDDSHVAMACTTRVFVWKPGVPRIAHKLLVARRDQHAIPCIAWSPDSSHIAFGFDAFVRIWNYADSTSNQTIELRNHSELVCSVGWSPDGQLIASASKDSISVWRWNVADGSFQQIAWHGVTQCHDSSRLGIARCDASPKLSWARDGSYLVTSACDGTLRFHDSRSNFRVEFQIPVNGEVQDMEWSHDFAKLHVMLKTASAFVLQTFSLPATGSILAALGFHFSTAAPWDWTSKLCSSPQAKSCERVPGRCDVSLALSAAQIDWDALSCGLSSRRVGNEWIDIRGLEINNWSVARGVPGLPVSCAMLCERLSAFVRLNELLLQGPLVRGFWMCGLLAPTLKQLGGSVT